jgi:hypothetical protein
MPNRLHMGLDVVCHYSTIKVVTDLRLSVLAGFWHPQVGSDLDSCSRHVLCTYFVAPVLAGFCQPQVIDNLYCNVKNICLYFKGTVAPD